MTITVTDLVAGPFVPTGGEQILPFEFKAMSAAEVEVVQVLDGVEVAVDFTLTPNTDLAGAIIEGGEVTVTADADLGEIYVRAAPSFEQGQHWSDTGSSMSALNEALDRGTLRDIYLLDEVGDRLRAPAVPAAGYLALNADGDTVMASGTGTDSNLRPDLGLSTGASLIGVTRGGSVQAALNAMLAQQGAYARDHAPFGGDTFYGDVWPNAVNLVDAVRMTENLILVRVWRNTIIDEFVLRDPDGYVGVSAGWQIVSHRGFWRGQVFDWFRNPDEDSAMTIVDFAIRIGPLSEPYHSGGEGPIYAFAGFGHSRMDVFGTPQIILDGGGPNLQSIANWPVGVRKTGDALSVSAVYKLRYWNSLDPAHAAWANAEAVSLTRTLAFGNSGGVNHGLSDTVAFTPLIAGVGIQDAYTPMAAVNFGGYADTAKLNGYPAVPMIADDTQKGNWHGPKSGTLLQFYNAADPTIAQVTEIVYGPPMRINGVDQDWSRNHPFSGRIHVTDGKDFSKFRVFIASSEITLPRTAWSLPMGETWTMLTRRRTDYLPGGVT